MKEPRKRPLRTFETYAPSPGAIREECEHIQATWTERERRKRAGRVTAAAWTPPRVDLAAVTEALREDVGNSPPSHWPSANDWDR